MKKTIILSLGGSIIVPDQIDTVFLKKFSVLIRRNLKRFRFIIVAGGGHTNRLYNEAARKVGKVVDNDLDLIGIMATRLNAEFVRVMFSDVAEKIVVYNPKKKVSFKKQVLIGAGYVPGSSTDLDAVELAKSYGAKQIINLSNTDFAYTKDPKKYRDAKPIKAISWDDFIKIVGTKWVPRLNRPFDPTASKAAKRLGLRVISANGRNLANLQNILDDKPFNGTVIG